jgi:hypothetical protein
MYSESDNFKIALECFNSALTGEFFAGNFAGISSQHFLVTGVLFCFLFLWRKFSKKKEGFLLNSLCQKVITRLLFSDKKTYYIDIQKNVLSKTENSKRNVPLLTDPLSLVLAHDTAPKSGYMISHMHAYACQERDSHQ